MISAEIPKNYTASPSSYIGTPSLTINHDAAVNLDSTDAFEGPEKLLEVWFALSPAHLPSSASPDGLREVSEDTWKEMLDLVHCKVLSIIRYGDMDAYLLSESSMFVFPHKLVLKTCGTTTLLHGLPRILEVAATIAGFPHVSADLVKGIPAAATPYRVFYSRKNFLNPDKQRGPHRSWRDEVRFLDRMFLGGSAYMIGKMNGEHWYLYITTPDTRLTPPGTPDSDKGGQTETKYLNVPQRMSANGYNTDDAQDETLEVLMTDLDEENARQFYLEDASAVATGRVFQQAHPSHRSVNSNLVTIREDGSDGIASPYHSDSDFDVFEQTSSDHCDFKSDDGLAVSEELTTEGHALGTVVSDSCGLSDVYPKSKYPNARIDAYLFSPCGFSANGIIPAPADAETDGLKGTQYFTVHVTPEPQCSYASFETNVPARQSGRETADIVEQVVNIFKPGRFTVTLFEAKPEGGEGGIAEAKKTCRMDCIKGYKRVDRIVHDLDGYDLVFRYYERLGWQGGAPRLGEAIF